MKITILFGLLENFLIGNLGSSSHCSKSQRRNANFCNTARKSSGPVTVINWNPHKFSPDLNLAWIQKQADECSQICHGTHIKFKLGFQSLLKNSLPNIFFFFSETQWLWIWITESQFKNCVPNRHWELRDNKTSFYESLEFRRTWWGLYLGFQPAKPM